MNNYIPNLSGICEEKKGHPSRKPYFAPTLCLSDPPEARKTVSFNDSPSESVESKRKQSTKYPKNRTKRIKNQMIYPKQNNKTVKQKKLMKKAIKKEAKIPGNFHKSGSFISISTSASNATPKICLNINGDYIIEEQTEVKFPVNEQNFFSNQMQINESFLDQNLCKCLNEESKFSPKDWLQNHKINSFMRARMVDWMIEVLASFHCSNETFFLAVNLMDRYLEKKTNCLPDDLHLLGVACMFIASKYEDVYPIKLNSLWEKAVYDKLSKEQIKDKEFEVLETLNFDALGPNLFTFTQIMINKLDLKNQIEPEKMAIMNDLLCYMNKMASYEYTIIKNSKASLISAATFLVSFKLFEQIGRNFSISSNIQNVKMILGLKEQEIIEKANQLLLLAKNFDKLYQSTNNLKKFNQILFDQLKQYQTKNSCN